MQTKYLFQFFLQTTVYIVSFFFFFILLLGIREVNNSFARTLGLQLNRSLTPSIPMTPTPLTNPNNNQSTFVDKWPVKPSPQRPHPYSRQ